MHSYVLRELFPIDTPGQRELIEEADLHTLDKDTAIAYFVVVEPEPESACYYTNFDLQTLLKLNDDTYNEILEETGALNNPYLIDDDRSYWPTYQQAEQAMNLFKEHSQA